MYVNCVSMVCLFRDISAHWNADKWFVKNHKVLDFVTKRPDDCFDTSRWKKKTILLSKNEVLNPSL